MSVTFLDEMSAYTEPTHLIFGMVKILAVFLAAPKTKCVGYA